jgi:hypothetical protein
MLSTVGMRRNNSTQPKRRWVISAVSLLLVGFICSGLLMKMGIAAIDDHSYLYRAEANFAVFTPVRGAYSGKRLYVMIDDGNAVPGPTHVPKSKSKTFLCDALADLGHPTAPPLRLATVDEVNRLGTPLTKTLHWDGSDYKYRVEVHGEEISIDYRDETCQTACAYMVRNGKPVFSREAVLRDDTNK